MSERPNNGPDANDENVQPENQPTSESETWDEDPGTVQPEFEENETVDSDISSLDLNVTAETVQPQGEESADAAASETISEGEENDADDDESGLAKTTIVESFSDDDDDSFVVSVGDANRTLDTVQPPTDEEFSDTTGTVAESNLGQTADTIQPPPAEEFQDATTIDGDSGGATVDTIQPERVWDEASFSVTINTRDMPLSDSGVPQGGVDTVNETAYFDQFFAADRDGTSSAETNQLTNEDTPSAAAVRREQRELETVFDGESEDEGGEIDKTVVGGSLLTRGGLDEQETTDEGSDSFEMGTVDSAARTRDENRDSGSVTTESGLLIQPRDLVDAEDARSQGAEFELLEAIGKGGMGVVYRANQASMNRRVAIKMIKQEKSRKKKDRTNFLAEAVVTGELDHPNIVPIYDVAKTRRNELFYSMKEVKGTPWDRKVKEMSVAQNLSTLLRVCDAIAFAHDNGVSHCDLKPENTMIGEYGEVLVMDWGLAVVDKDLAERKGISSEPKVGGTPAYMSPELGIAAFSMFPPVMMKKLKLPEIKAEDSKAAIKKFGPPTDIYLLGAILFEIVVGEPPHTGKNWYDCIGNAAKNIIRDHKKSGELLDIAMKAMATNTEDRYASVKDFQAAIREYQEHLESLRLQNEGEGLIKKAATSDKYDEYQQAIFAFSESIKIWNDNHTARERLADTKFMLSERALGIGDLDFAKNQLDAQNSRHAQLVTRINSAIEEREASVRRAQRNRMLLAAAVVIMIVGGASFGIYQRSVANTIAGQNKQITKQNDEITKQNEEITERNEEIEKQNKTIIAQKQEVTLQRDAAIKAKGEEEKQRKKAEKAVIAETKAKKQLKVKNDALKKSNDALAKSIVAERAAKDLANEKKEAAEAAEKKAKKAQIAEAKERKKAEEAQKKEADARKKAEDATKVAKAEKKKADDARDAEKIAKIKAVKAQELAEENERKALYEQYTAQIGLIDEKIRTSAFDRAGALLAELLFDRFKDHRNWEFDRLKYIAELGDENATDTKKQLTALSFHPDGTEFATACGDGIVRVYDANIRDKQLKEFAPSSDGPHSPVQSAVYSPDGKLLITGAADGTITVWQTANPQSSKQLRGHEKAVVSLAVSKDGQRLVSGSADRTVRLWNLTSLKQIAIARHIYPVRSVAITSGTVRIKRTKTQTEGRLAIATEKETVERECVVVATGSKDEKGGKAVVWAIESNLDGQFALQRYKEFLAHGFQAAGDAHARPGAVFAATFSPDNSVIASCGVDHRVLIWSWQASNAPEPNEYIKSLIDTLEKKSDTKSAAVNYIELKDTSSAGKEKDAKTDAHSDAVRSLAFSDDGNLLISTSDDFTVKVWDFKNNELVRRLRGHRGFVISSAFAPNQDRPVRLITASTDQTVRRWHVNRDFEALNLDLKEHADAVSSAIFDPSGKYVLTASADHTAKLWDISDTSNVEVIGGNANATSQATFHEGSEVAGSRLLYFQNGEGENNGYLLTGAMDGSIRIWDAHNHTEQLKINGTGLLNTFAAVSKNGQWLVTGSSATGDQDSRDADRQVKLWRLANLKNQTELNSPTASHTDHAGQVSVVAISDDGNLIFSGDNNGFAVLWNRVSISRHRMRLHSGPINSAQFLNAGRHVVTCGDDGQLSIWNSADGKLVTRYTYYAAKDGSLKLVGSIVRMSVSPNGKQIAALCDSGRVDKSGVRLPFELKLISVTDQSLTETKSISVERGFRISTMTFVPGNGSKHLIAAGARTRGDGSLLPTIRRWNLETARDDTDTSKPFFTSNRVGATVQSATYSSNGREVYTLEGTSIQKWDAVSRTVLGSFRPHKAVAAAGFSSDGKYIVTGGRDQSIKIWNRNTKKSILSSADTMHDGPITAAQFGPKGMDNIILTASEDGKAKLWTWNVQAGTLGNARVVAQHKAGINSAVFSSDGKRILTASNDGTAKIWNLNGKIIRSMRHTATANDQEILSASFSSDNKLVITSGADNNAIIWTIASGQEKLTLPGHPDDVTCAAFSPDGNRVITGCRDGYARIWDVTDESGEKVGSELLTLRGHDGGITSVAFSTSKDGRAQHALTASLDNTARVWLVDNPQKAKSESKTASIK